MRNLVQRKFPEGKRDDENVDRGLSAMRKEYRNRWNSKTKPYKGIAEMLHALVDKGLKITVLFPRTF